MGVREQARWHKESPDVKTESAGLVLSDTGLCDLGLMT